jgi:predicted acetyltransferase
MAESGAGDADIDVRRVPIEDSSVLRNLVELYRYDFSELTGRDADDHGLFGYRYLDHYWTEPDRHPFLIRVGGKLAGFVLVRSRRRGDGVAESSIAEFFVMRKYRRRGVGRTAARRVFDMFPGRWTVMQLSDNVTAQSFWRDVITGYTEGAFSETLGDNPPTTSQEFTAPGRTG